MFRRPYRFLGKIVEDHCQWLPDRIYLKIIFRYHMGYKLNLRNPRTFSEKIQWLKLYNRNPLYTTMVDKYLVKEYVSEKIGSQYIIPTIGRWDHPEDINWDSLPNQFVLKTNHGGGNSGVVICKDKSTFNKDLAIQKLNNSLKDDIYKHYREWPYKNVKKCIIAEEYMEDYETKELRDYKFFCMDGVCKALFIAKDRQNRSEPYFDFFDANFRHLDIQQGHPNAPESPSRPKAFNLMKDLAQKISENLPEVRIDFYEVNGKAYFGEITFFHFSGLCPFYPPNIDIEWGEWINLSSEMGGG